MKIKNKAKEVPVMGQNSTDPRMIFIRNLPYKLTDPELQEVFSEIGPVRRSFLVKEKGKEDHRGFGFVQFAAAEHATLAVEIKDGSDLQGRKIKVSLANRRPPFEARRAKKNPDHDSSKGDNLASDADKEGSPQKSTSELHNMKKETLCNEQIGKDKKHSNGLPVISKKKKKKIGNNIPNSDILSGGQEKDNHKREMLDEVSKRKGVVVHEEKSSAKQRVARTVVFGGLGTPEMREEVIECARKIGSVESVQSSLSHQELKGRGLERDGCKMGAASVVYTSVKAACHAVAAIHGKTIGGGIVWARQQGGEGSKVKKWRVIIRNLPFNITEDKIREMFKSIGFVWEITIPKKPDGQVKGFAFASFTSKDHAEKAISMVNGKILQKRTIAVDWAVERNLYEKNADEKPEDNAEKSPSDIDDEDTASESEIEEEGAEDVESTIVEELDMAKKVLQKFLSTGGSKDELNTLEDGEETAVRGEENDEETTSISEEEDDFEGVEPVEELHLSQNLTHEVVESGRNKLKSTDRNGNALKGVPSEIIAESEHHIEENSMDGRKDVGREDLNRTVFIQNLPFDVNSEDLKKHFLTFGKVKSVFLVLHPKTKRPKGSAFLEFLSEHDAEAALSAAKGEGEFVNGIVFGGRKLEVLKAMAKNTAKAIAKEKLETPNVDRRNLYLAEEGKIDGTPAARGVSDEDMQKRRQLEQVKATKLRSPNFHVSRTRLAMYNVPKSMTEPELRQLLIDAVKSRATKQNPFVKQVSILKDKAKDNRSRGVAFVEFSEHEHALVALRVLNNNPETFGPERRPIVGFAIENVQKLKKFQLQRMEHANRKANHEGEVINRQLSARKAKSHDANEKSDSENRFGKRNREDDESNSEKQSKQGRFKLFETKKRKRNPKLDNAKSSRDSIEQDVKLNEKFDSGNGFENQSKQDDSKSFGSKKRRRNSKLKNDKDTDSGSTNQKRKLQVSKKLKTDEDVQSGKVSASKKQKTSVAKFAKNNAAPANHRTMQRDRKPAVSNDENTLYTNQPKVKKNKKNAKVEIQDKLDQLVAKYRSQYFSDGSNAKKSMNGNTSSDIKRWFD